MRRLALTVAADPRAPRAVAAAVADHLADVVLRDADQVRAAVHEAVANAVLHGGGPIRVTAGSTGDGAAVEVVVVDGGSTPRTTGPRRPPDERGRGHRVMAACSDRVTVERGRGPTAGWRVRLRYAPRLGAATDLSRPSRP